jgi:PadR family transcriptional regulator, regulatory protein PadR
MSRPADLVQGTLDALILSLLARESLHGLAISQRLRESSADVLQVSHGSLYPALHKLQLAGLVRGDWRSSESGKRAKFYTLTRAGRKRLVQEAADWQRLSAAISLVLRPA